MKMMSQQKVGRLSGLKGEQKLKGPALSPSRLGFSMAAGISLFSVVVPVLTGGTIKFWGLALAVIFVLISFAVPKLLAPLAYWADKMVRGLQTGLSFVLMALLFWGMIVPFAAVMRRKGHNFLDLKLDPHATSYWTDSSGSDDVSERFKHPY
ncbi:hypothetical protein [Cohaesibacter celericrescens]|uniref:hypothetical protein n=1 Tax=Cohaesibacter celericrescens TaxID=2067669 RepID=UPI00356309A9